MIGSLMASFLFWGGTMEKKITITMSQIDGAIEYKHDGDPTYAEALGMLEYVKMWIYHDWTEEIKDQ